MTTQLESQYDVVVIGGGPAGYTAADRAASRGLKTLLVERDRLGGTCLNAGCIPSKALLASAKLFSSLRTAEKFGVMVSDARFDLPTANARVRRVVDTLRDGVAYQMDRRGVQVMHGHAVLRDDHHIDIDGTQVRAEHFIIATGSRPVTPAIPGLNLPHVWSTTDALYAERLPSRLTIIGGDILGLVFASIYSQLGVPVTVITPHESPAPDLDADVWSALQLEMKGVKFATSTQVAEITAKGLRFQGDKDETIVELAADTILLCAGREPAFDGLGLEAAGVDTSGGHVHVDEQMRTSVPHIYAIGDVTGESRWAHAALRMADVAVNTMTGQPDRFRKAFVPLVLYSAPEAASVGLTEAQAAAHGHRVAAARLPMAANGRFLTEYEGKRGVCKVVTDADSGLLLGVHLLAPNASELIWGAAAMLEDEFRVRDAKEIVFPHPTMAESMRDVLFEL
ncbi:MAG: dihydrolipoyl dehydrogenase [Pleurocapsa minor GSE-CHR-MK-17-07R]|jgi:dihydrolipoamide dehydrogenase|nr:dihydrolipoyl dehydrogenase [Pleurocapsa minor GSE-CHR-MK 17-07R]